MSEIVIYDDGDFYLEVSVDKDSTCSILEQVTKDGKNRKMNLYNLDMIIALGIE